MMDIRTPSNLAQAERDFEKARNQAFWSEIWSRLLKRPNELLSFEQVRNDLRLSDERYLGRRDIPLDKIVGSVGRYYDFTREFLPKKSVSRERWKTVDLLTLGAMGFPPIEAYKVGDAYFVLDGNHRVSVARANKMKTIEGYVTEFSTPVPFDETTRPDDLILKAEYASFLRQTRLDILRPGCDILLTEAGTYGDLVQHIEGHQYFLGLDYNRTFQWDEAVCSWYDNVYVPMIISIDEHNMLRKFPKRTEADLYVWLMRHQEWLQEVYGNFPSAEETVENFIEQL